MTKAFFNRYLIIFEQPQSEKVSLIFCFHLTLFSNYQSNELNMIQLKKGSNVNTCTCTMYMQTYIDG